MFSNLDVKTTQEAQPSERKRCGVTWVCSCVQSSMQFWDWNPEPTQARQVLSLPLSYGLPNLLSQRKGGREGEGRKMGRKGVDGCSCMQRLRSETEIPDFTGVLRLKVRAEVLVESHTDRWDVPLPRQSHTASCTFPTTPYHKTRTHSSSFSSRTGPGPCLCRSSTVQLTSPPGPPPWPERRRGGTWAGERFSLCWPLQGVWKGPTWLPGLLKIELCLNSSSIGLA